jgi:hydrogenase maturation protein HypF
MTTDAIRRRLTITGVVQGVGFRPYVYGLAHSHHLSGFVGNDSGGVFLEIEGSATAVAQFIHTLTHQPPPLAHIETITAKTILPLGDNHFTIVPSAATANQNTLISPDICTCDDCLRELLDPTNRRYLYPFTNCTNCGPRFTIIQAIPYDRPFTTMAPFVMCAACQAEYDNPLDRRFHAQPNACAECGPHLFLWQDGAEISGNLPALQQTRHLLHNGRIVAIKGLGGFHLACDATNPTAVHTLRTRKGRVDKPFAIMVANVETVRQIAHLSPLEAQWLTSKERPILLLQKKSNHLLTDELAPGNSTIGVMLPYTPLHTLLFTPLPNSPPPPLALVMTSANYSNEPIVQDNGEALAQLPPLADALLMHNREIYGRCDDSVIRITQNSPLPIRRSRGYAPFPVRLPHTVPPILAVGGELKATFCLANGSYGYMSQHIGDMENVETLAAFTTAVAHYQTIFHTQPELIVCDSHPGYLSTQWAHELARQAQLSLIAVQHHHAHIAALMAEHQHPGAEPVIGFSFDGTGYGTDGAIWGGEVLIADYAGFERAAHLRYVPLAGGDTAVKRPYRLALAHLWHANIPWDPTLPAVVACPAAEQRILQQQLTQGIHTVPTSSMGRLFDAIAALIGVRQTVTYEGQAAIELEAIADDTAETTYAFAIVPVDGRYEIDAAPLLHAIVQDWQQGVSAATIAAQFHHAVAHLIGQMSIQLRADRGLNTVALSGGVFQNVRLLQTAVAHLQAHHFTVLTHHLLPPNDGGIALGQAMIGYWQHNKRT